VDLIGHISGAVAAPEDQHRPLSQQHCILDKGWGSWLPQRPLVREEKQYPGRTSTKRKKWVCNHQSKEECDFHKRERFHYQWHSTCNITTIRKQKAEKQKYLDNIWAVLDSGNTSCEKAEVKYRMAMT